MKLPRLSSPKTIRIIEGNLLGDRIETEITTASQFDLLPTWAQWSFLAIGVLFIILAITAVVLQKIGDL